MSDLSQILNQVPRAVAGNLSGLSVSVVENLFLSLVDGRRTVENLADACGLDGEMASRVAIKLARAGVLQLDSKSSRSSTDALTEELDFMVSQIGTVNHYRLLGVGPFASRSDIRSAYFALSKKYHPDRQFGQRDDVVTEKMAKVFAAITEAYETLSGKQRRASYDQSIADELEMWKMEEQLKSAVSQNRATVPPVADKSPVVPAGRPVVRATPIPRGGAPRVSTPPPPDRVDVRRSARISRVSVTRSSVMPPPTRSAEMDRGAGGVARTSSSAIERSDRSAHDQRRAQWKAERLKRALGRSSTPAPVRRSSSQPGEKSSEALFDLARIAVEQRAFDVADQYITQLLSRDGHHAGALALQEQVRVAQVKERALEAIRRGRRESVAGNKKEALAYFERALKLDNESIDARFYLAELLLELRRDLGRGMELCREMIGLGGKRARHFALMAEYFALNQDNKRAEEALKRAIRLEPEDKTLQKRFKTLIR